MAFANFAILLLSARLLGSDIVGQVSLLILNIAIIQTINEIYTGSAVVYFIPKSAVSSIYKQGFLFALVCTLILNIGFILLQKQGSVLWPHLLCLSFMITLNAFHNVLLLAKEKIKQYNLLVMLQPILMLTLLSLQLLMSENRHLQVYIVALYGSYGITLFLSTYYLRRVLTNNTGQPAVSMAAVIKNGFMNQLGNLAHTLSNRLNYYLLGSAALVGVYASSTSLIESVLIISGSISPIVLSHVANQKDSANNAALSLTLAKICFVAGLLCVVLLVLMPSAFFTFVLGKDFEQTKQVMLFLSPGVVCLSFSSILSHYFSGLGLQKIQLSANVSGLVITLFTAWPFIHLFGLVGACYAASLAYFTQALVLTLVFMKQNNVSLAQLLSPKIESGILKK